MGKKKGSKRFGKGAKQYIRAIRISDSSTLTIAIEGLWGLEILDADPEDEITLIALKPVGQITGAALGGFGYSNEWEVAPQPRCPLFQRRDEGGERCIRPIAHDGLHQVFQSEVYIKSFNPVS